MLSNSSKKIVQVYYDSECAICSRFMTVVSGASQKEHVECKPLQNLDKNDVFSQEFHIITQDGKVYRKIYRKFDAILKIGEMYPKWRFPAKCARLPLLYQILSLGYELFAAHRYGISNLLDRFMFLKIVLTLVTISSLLLSYRLWLSTRLYPQVPITPLLPTIPFPFDYIVFSILLLLLLLSLVYINSRMYIIAFVCVVILYMFFDQSRFQPEFYQFLLMFIALSVYSWNNKNKRLVSHICCFIIASVYIYSGLQKINVTFTTLVFPWFIEPIKQFIPKMLISANSFSSFFIPFLEMGIGVGLVTKRFRSLAIIMAIAMHLAILFLLGPLGHNWNNTVWPWNIAMCCFVVILFWHNKTFSLRSLLSIHNPFGIVVILLCGVFPLLSFFNMWDSYLSVSLYSGNTKSAQLYIRNVALRNFDPRLLQYMRTQGTKYNVVDLDAWSYQEMNVPAYPENRIFKSIAKSLCPQVRDPLDMILEIKDKPNWITGKSTLTKYVCNNL